MANGLGWRVKIEEPTYAITRRSAVIQLRPIASACTKRKIDSAEHRLPLQKAHQAVAQKRLLQIPA